VNKPSELLILFFLLLLGIGLRYPLLIDNNIHEWDEKYHALVAKNLASDLSVPRLYRIPVMEKHRSWTKCNEWLSKGPVGLYSMALGCRLFGGDIIAIRIVSMIYFLLSCMVTFLLGKFISPGVALLSVFFMAINGLYITSNSGMISSDHIDTAFVFYISLSIYLLASYHLFTKKILLCIGGISIGVAFLVKWVAVFFICPWMLYMLWRKRTGPKPLVLFIMGVSAPVMIYFSYALCYYPDEIILFVKSLYKPILFSIQGHSGYWYYYLLSFSKIYGEIILLGLFLWLWINNKKTTRVDRDIKTSLLVLVLSVVFVLSICQTKRHTYLQILMAPTCLINSFIILDIIKSIRNGFIKPWAWIVVILLILLPIRYSYERMRICSHSFGRMDYLSYLLPYKLDECTILTNDKWAMEHMFYNDCQAFVWLSEEELLYYSNLGYTIVDYATLPTITEIE